MTMTGMTLHEKFEAFHEANPQVYVELVTLARQALKRGYKTYSINSLFEVVRWQRDISPLATTDEFKLNNNFRSRYARLIMEQEPDLAGFFETRQLHTLTAYEIALLKERAAKSAENPLFALPTAFDAVFVTE